MSSSNGRGNCGTVTRRQLLKTAAAAGVAGSALFGLNWSSVFAQALQGNRVTIAFASAPINIDPAQARSSEEYMITQAVYDNLFRLDHNLTAQPALAVDWRVEGLTWTFELRRGVRFHDGRELTAADVVYSLNRIMDPDVASISRASFSMIEKITAVDDHTVAITLHDQYGDLPLLLAGFHARIIPEGSGDTIRREPNGTGPFRFRELVPGSHAHLERFDGYWDEGIPHLAEVRQVQIPEDGAQIAAISGDAVQILWEPRQEILPVLSALPGIKLLEVPSAAYQPITMNLTQPPFHDNRVRLALKYCVDREQMRRAVLMGRGTVAQDHPVSSTSPFWADIPTRPRDIQRAKELLAEAGYGNGLNLELVASSERPGLVDQAVAFKEMAAEANVHVDIKVVPWDIFVAQYGMGRHPFYVQNWVGRPTIDEALYNLYHSEGTLNSLGFANERVDELLVAGRRETDFERRKEIYAEVQRILSDEGPEIISFHRPYVTAVRENVEGYAPHPLRLVELRDTRLA